MVRTFTRNHPPRGDVDDQDNTQVLESDLNDFQTLLRNLFVGGAEQEQSNTSDDDERTPIGYATQLEEQFHISSEARRRHSRHNTTQPVERPVESARTGEQPAAVVATRNSPALSNVVVPTKPRGSGKLNLEPSSSRHNEALLKKNVDVERQLKDGYDQPQGQRYQLGSSQDVYQDNQYPFEQGREYRGRQFNRRGQGQRSTTQNQKDRKGVGYAGIPPPSGTINMISGGIHSGGQSAWGRKVYARQVMTINKNRPLKWPFKEAEWENPPITFSSIDYKRAEGKPNVMIPHADPFVATVHIGNHNVNKVFIDTGSSPDILYWSCFQKMQLNWSSLQKYEDMGRATLCELKAVISQPHLCMKFPTPQGVGVLKGNQKMARAYYQDTFKKVELTAAPVNQDVFAWTTDEMLGIPTELAVHKLSTDPTRRPVVHKRHLFGLEKFIARSAKRYLPFFKALREPKNFQWTDECQQALDELKQYLVSAPLLLKPVEGESLYLYLWVTEEALSSVLLKEHDKHQKPICYMSKVLQGAEQNYPLAEKAAFALVYTARKLRAYFQLHKIVIYTDLPRAQPLKGRLWHTSVDFLVECLSTNVEEKAPIYPAWVLYVDGAANIEGSGAGAVLVGPYGFKSEHALRFKFQTTNNVAEYEALIYGLKLAFKLKV
ncbi:hypothetical protein SLEP1_g30619 [Rubroshorea leprosula]|uniref:RNase H type-1 domain-containing protein n=1 Tax=Rubroshorea leprosula TaxID=152421 RepID=A0AAV5KAK3_9ROSI|nr:hypothetical protein SLEP1_g30619 [Rubroshorea leprosula]